jgi:flagellar hook assembly protein FlgD
MDITVTGRNVIPYEGTIDVGDVGVREQELLNNGQSFGLEIYPNPCNGITNIKYSLGHSTKYAALKIYDVTGRLVKNFSLPTSHFSLPTSVVWDGTDDIGRNVPEGIYFIYFSTENYEKSEKIILLK